MKKFSLLFLFFITSTCYGGSLQSKIANHFNVAPTITPAATADYAWKIFNATTNTKTIFITKCDLMSSATGYFVIYSSAMITGLPFTGDVVGVTPITPAMINSAATSISSVTTATSASSPTGEIIWRGLVGANEMITAIDEENPIGIIPGVSVYVLKDNSVAGEISAASFRLVETYRP